MRKFTKILIISFLLLLPISPAAGQAQENGIGETVEIEGDEPSAVPGLNFSGCTRVDVAAVNAAYEQQVVELVNQERWNNGQLPPYKRNAQLDLAARYHAKDMADDDYFAHDSYDGSSLVCSWSTRVSNWYSGWSALSENIAWGYGTPAAVMSGWMDSPPHRGSILSTNYREFGVGYYTGSLWVQDFGRKSAVFPIVINREAAQTDTYQVSLYVYGEGTFTQMRLKNDNDAFGSWIPFSKNLNWSLRQLQGTRTVTVELKKADGSITTSADTIYLTDGAEFSVTPASILFIYDQSTGQIHPAQVAIQPQNSGGTLTLNWTADPEHNWIGLSQASGVTPNSTTQISIAGLDTSTPGVFNSSVEFTVTDPPGAGNSPVTIPVQVSVVANLNQKIYIAALRR